MNSPEEAFHAIRHMVSHSSRSVRGLDRHVHILISWNESEIGIVDALVKSTSWSKHPSLEGSVKTVSKVFELDVFCRSKHAHLLLNNFPWCKQKCVIAVFINARPTRVRAPLVCSFPGSRSPSRSWHGDIAAAPPITHNSIASPFRPSFCSFRPP